MIEYNRNILDWLQMILQQRFGHAFQLSFHNYGSLDIGLSGENGVICFDVLLPVFFTEGSSLPCNEWNPENENFNSVLGKPLPAPGSGYLAAPLIEKKSDGYFIHYDILGLVYWMLSRQEEVGRNDLDNHGRFPATSSHAFKHGYLDRPVVDEWLDILGQVIFRLWPQLTLKQHHPRTVVSCDVDLPYLFYSKSLKATLRVMLGDILKRRSPKLAINNLNRYLNFLRDCYSSDPYICAIDWIMDVNEQEGNTVAFYFIPEQHDPVFDSFYSMDEPVIRYLMQQINSRDHEIGLHTSYTTYQDGEQTKREAEILRLVMQKEGISQFELGGRQHYLRWETPTTALNWDNAGMTYDSTLGYADRPGFRCGTCHEYPMFDPVQGKALLLRQRPLVVMECSVISDGYLGLGYSKESIALMKKYKDICYRVGGDFTLLWHNSHFTCEQDKDFYKELIG